MYKINLQIDYKWIYIVVIILTVFSGVFHAKSSALNDFYTDAARLIDNWNNQVSDFLENPFEGVASEIVEDITANVQAAAGIFLDNFIDKIVGSFNPSLNLFYRASRGPINNTVSDVYVYSYWDTDTHGNTSLIIDVFREYSTYIGITIATLLFGWGIVFYMFSGKFTESKDNPIRLLVMYIVSLIAIIYAQDIMNYFLETAQELWEYSVEITEGINVGVGRLMAGHFWMNQSGTGSSLSATIMGVAFPGLGVIATACIVIIGLFLTWQLVKGFLKLWLEMAERYLVMCFMVLFFPCVAPFMISKDTVVIIKSYFRMFIAQLFLLLMGSLFIKGFVYMLSQGTQYSVMGYAFIMAYLRVAQRLDSYMTSMGFNVAQTGAGLFDSFEIAVHNVGYTLKGANEFRKGVAGSLKGKAIGTGNQGLFEVASIAGISTDNIVSTGTVKGLNDIGSMEFFRQSVQAGRPVKNVPPSVAQEAVKRFLNVPTNENMNMVSVLSDKTLKTALKDEKAIPVGMSLKTARINRDGTILISGTTSDGNFCKGKISQGALNNNSKPVNGTIKDLYFTPEKT